jgi:hypothetical protein
MKPPRFSLRTLSAIVAIAAVWFAMLVSVSPLAEDVLRAMQLMLPIAALSAVVYYHGNARAYWLGFLATLIAGSLPIAGHFGELFGLHLDEWSNSMASDVGTKLELNWVVVSHIENAIKFLFLIVVSICGGGVMLFVYKRSKPEAK